MSTRSSRQHVLSRAAVILTALTIGSVGALAPATAGFTAPSPSETGGPAVGTSRSPDEARTLASRTAGKVVAGRPAYLHASPDDAYIQDEVVSSGQHQYVPYRRTYRGVPVVGGDFVLVMDKAGKVVFSSVAQRRAITALSTTPTLSKARAESIAKQRLVTVSKVESTRLVVYALGVEPARLAWESVVVGTGAAGDSRLRVDVDARTGAIIATKEHVLRGSGTGAWNGPNPLPLRTIQSGGSFLLSDPDTSNMPCQNLAADGTATTFSGPDDLWGNGDAADRETGCVDALYGAERMRDMLSAWLGRNGMNGSGGAWPIRVGLDEQNAFYDGTQVKIGHNPSNQWVGSVDIIAHEMGHGVDDTTPGSFSLAGTQEFIADAFGTATEWFVNEPAPHDVPDFLVGEQVNLVGSGPIRNMFNPSALGDPNCYSSSIPNTEVHAAAGPGNHWFYLLAMGSNPGNGQPDSPTCNGSTVTGAVGVQNAIRILYNAMLMKNSDSSYLTYRTWTLQAAKNLDPSCAMFATTKAAWDAVSVPAQAGDPTCSAWAELPGGGVTPSAPAATSTSSGRYVFVRGFDDRIYLNLNGTGWGEVPGNGVTPDAPAATVLGSSVNVFVRGMDDRIYLNRLNGASWSGWGEVPGNGTTPSAPAAVVMNNTLHLFVRGMDDRIYVNRFNGATWTGWSEVPGNGLTPDAPAATVLGNNLYLFVRGMDDRIYVNRFNGTTWTGWSEVPGNGGTPSAPGAAASATGLNLVVRGFGDRIYLNRFNGTAWTGWNEVPGNGLTPDAPAATVHGGSLFLYVRALNDHIFVNSLNP